MYDITRPDHSHQPVDADEHRVEGGFHVFRRTTTVMGQPRTMVLLRLPAAEVVDVQRV